MGKKIQGKLITQVMKVHLSPKALTDLDWWANHQQNTNSYKQSRSNHHIGFLRSGLGSMVWEKIGSRPVVSGGNILTLNLRELQAENLAPKMLSWSQLNHIQLQMDNQAAISCINTVYRGEHIETSFLLSLGLWNWSLSRQIHISTRYIPGIFNKHVDHMSRKLRLSAEWKLNSMFLKVLNMIYLLW